MSLALAAIAGALIGLSLGALGGGGSILAVPVLVYLLGQSPAQATTGSLVVVGVTSLIGAATAHRAGNVMLGRGAAFGAIALVGAVVGARASAAVPEPALLAAFAALMLLVGLLMLIRQVRGRRGRASPAAGRDGAILTFRPRLQVHWPRAALLVGAATVVGLLTGFLGVGGGFLVVPALVLTLAMPMPYAAGTSLVVITLTSAVALLVRTGAGVTPDWAPVLVLTTVSALAGFGGARLAARLDTRTLSAAFTALVLVVAVYTAARALPGVL